MSDADTVSLTTLPPDGPAPNESGVMSLVDHLSELRTRIVRAVLAIVVGGVVGFYFGEQIQAVLVDPLPYERPLISTGIGDPFAIRLRIAIVVGIILAMPVLVWQIWAFVAPGLTPAERKTIRPWLLLAFVFFALGVGIAWIVLPFAAGFLLQFQSPTIESLLDARQYFDFVSTLFLAFGLLMEFPIVLVALSRVGIVTSGLLARSRRIVILGIAIFAAAVTPGGDLVSPGVLGITMYILYELTIVLIRRSGR
ncbi:MAG: twin-arginine translocase subunit TatC [Chloroflexi bacterium]|nr:twin-arginine translocase subunit TatC [Chloroflexota bacterium]